ncbi:nucleotidyltransferase family protein [Flagellimonas pacifica]|uniref:Molybdenum cofactor cytidylyltransferase n=1 Tax=Flagellimonas pacifica TaxID=1247520 RepID=A0A285MRW6_9FLAO|nr:nucleotidyltransferase family protein [Allomuricauda parva]SNY99910.1 molybdenum cofactor cytidylyltransferase [Allomuricauda parva]
MSNSIPILILAAGSSTRMEGEIKQLLPWGKTTLLENAINQAKRISSSVHVVLGANSEKILQSTTLKAHIIKNKSWKSGMGSSISIGVQHIMDMENVEALLIMLADQPLMDSYYLKSLIQEFVKGKHKIVATAYQDKAGVPAIFDNCLFEELASLHQDFGARNVIANNQEQTLLVDPKGREVDVDIKDEYIQILKKQNIKHV